MNGWPLWMLILALGLVTWAMRGAFFLLPPKAQAPITDQATVPEQQNVLRFAPQAVLAALVAPALVSGGTGTSWPFAQGLAGGVGLLVAICAVSHSRWRTRCVLLTLIGGMGTLWLLGLLGM